MRALVRCLFKPFDRCVIPCVLLALTQPLYAPARCFEPVMKFLRFQLVARVGGLPDALPRRCGEVDPPHVVAFIK